MGKTLDRLRQAITRCHLAADAFPASIRRLAAKLDLLAGTGRYHKLLSDLFACNDRSNLQALILEATFAHSFELGSRDLSYEVRQQPQQATSIDFLRATNSELRIYFELRLLQQADAVGRTIDDQLARHDRYAVSLDGEGEAREVLRLQNVLLSKVQDAGGNPIKFTGACPSDRNIVVVDVSHIILGAIDHADCVLATCGDSQVEEHERRNVFGLFQEIKPSYPDYIHTAHRRFAHFRSTVHGVLFLHRCPRNDPYDFELRYFFVPNYSLLAEAETVPVAEEIRAALDPWKP